MSLQHVSKIQVAGGCSSENRDFHAAQQGSPFMDRPRPFTRAHKREASGGLPGTKNSPQSKVQRMREWARVNLYLLAETEPCKRVIPEVSATWTTFLYHHSHPHRFSHQTWAKATKLICLDMPETVLSGC